jgi:hypothetical protein
MSPEIRGGKRCWRGFPGLWRARGWGKEGGEAGMWKRTARGADLQRMVWKEARGRFSKLSPSRRQCSSRSSSGFAVPFMAPHGPRVQIGALLARPQPELPAPASGTTVLPGHQSGAQGEHNRRPPGPGNQSSPSRGGGRI